MDPDGAINWIMRGLMDDRSAVLSSAPVVAVKIVALRNEDAYSNPLEAHRDDPFERSAHSTSPRQEIIKEKEV